MINLVVALPSEAQPLIEHFGMNAIAAHHSLKLYGGDGMRLMVCGMGKVSAAAAVGYLAGLTPDIGRHGWLNVGIAGHPTLELGSCRIADRIVDAASGKHHYPSLVMRAPCRRATVVTVDEPEITYPEAALFDMEASGFFRAAQRFTDIELVHVLKIVSDNQDNPTELINRQVVNELVRGCLSVVERCAEDMSNLIADQEPTQHAAPENLLERWHFTVTQTNQLLDYHRRWALLVKTPSIEQLTADCRDANEALNVIREYLDRSPLQLPKLSTRQLE